MPTYPYSSSQAAVVQTFGQLRKGGFPPKVDAGYLKRFSIAPANESYVISILRFLGLIDEEGNKQDENTNFFYGGDDVFTAGLEKAMRSAYGQLFDEMGADAWTSQRDDLTNWFRAADRTSGLVGQRQGFTFLVLAALAGHGEVPVARGGSPAKKTAVASASSAKKAATKKSTQSEQGGAASESSGGGKGTDKSNAQDVGLTVRIEVNLPPGGDAATYDAIFASIKKHLMS